MIETPLERKTGKEDPKVETSRDGQAAKETEGFDGKIREAAKTESLAYFRDQAKNLDVWLSSVAGMNTLATLLELSKGDAQSSEDLRQQLALPQDMEKWLPIMIQAVEQCKPITDVANVAEYVKKIIREKAEPSVRLAEAMKIYDEGTSWYHSTDEGKETLGRIRREIEQN